MQLLIMHFSPAPCYLPYLRSKYSPQHPVLKHAPLGLRPFRLRDQVSHPYSVRRITVVMHILSVYCMNVRDGRHLYASRSKHVEAVTFLNA